jgi:hypothetical protein
LGTSSGAVAEDGAEAAGAGAAAEAAGGDGVALGTGRAQAVPIIRIAPATHARIWNAPAMDAF